MTRRQLVKGGLLLTLTAVSLYLLAPSILSTFNSFPQLARISPWWLAAMVLLEAGSLLCLAGLQRLTLGRRPWPGVISSQLAGNAAAKAIPGGGATGAAVQYGMLRDDGMSITSAAAGVTAANLFTFATLLALPVLALPIILISDISVAHDLQTALWIGFGVLVVLLGAGAVLIADDRPLLWLGDRIQRAINRLRPRRPTHGLARRLVGERDELLRLLGDRWWEALLFVGGRWLLDFGALAAAVRALDSRPSISLLLLAFVAAQLLGQIPITPGGLGFVEAGLAAMLALAGVSAGDAVVATLGYRLVSYWLPMPVGLAAWWVHRRRLARKGPTGETTPAAPG